MARRRPAASRFLRARHREPSLMSALRLALCADFPEEQWPSMDRVANELVVHLRRSHSEQVDVTPVCPPFTRRATHIVPSGPAFTVDRVLNRWWDYPRLVES